METQKKGTSRRSSEDTMKKKKEQSQKTTQNTAAKTVGVRKHGKQQGAQRKVVLAVILVIVAILAVIYLAIAVYFSSHFYPGSTAVDVDVSRCTSADAQKVLEEQLASYTLTITGKETEDVLNASDMALQYDALDKALEQGIQNQNAAAWITKIFSKEKKSVLSDVVFDSEQLKTKLQETSCMNPEKKEKSKSAYISKKDFSVVSEKIGNIIEEEVLLEKVEAAIAAGETQLTLTDADYKQPKVLADSEEIKKATETVNKMLSAKITVKEGDKSIVIDKTLIKDFIKVSDGVDISINTKELQDYINNNFDPTFDTINRDRTIESAGSGTIQISGGTFGNIISTLKEVDQLTKEITEGTVTERRPIYRQETEQDSNGGVGDTYIDVSISNQTVWLVKNGKVVLSSSVVTGQPTDNRETPKGVYFVIRKARNYTMKKFKVTVDYWMPINDSNGVGLHDASWRHGSFGGSIYRHNGSHGCINLPPSVASEIFNSIDTGIPVIVH